MCSSHLPLSNLANSAHYSVYAAQAWIYGFSHKASLLAPPMLFCKGPRPYTSNSWQCYTADCLCCTIVHSVSCVKATTVSPLLCAQPKSRSTAISHKISPPPPVSTAAVHLWSRSLTVQTHILTSKQPHPPNHMAVGTRWAMQGAMAPPYFYNKLTMSKCAGCFKTAAW